jgi:hydroxymethylglutaryl-CoA lyase
VKVLAALESGCTRLDGAIGGMGGCPFAKSTLVGNVATEIIVDTLENLNIPHSLDKKKLKVCEEIKHEIFGVAVKELLLARTLKDENFFSALVISHFKRYDKSNSGMLDRKEFELCVKDVFAELGEQEPSSDRIDRAFKKLDVAEMGAITVDAYMLGVRRQLTKRLQELENA